MRKLFAIILSLLYLSIATGFSTYSHYCMDRYAGTSLWQEESNICPVCGMEKQDDTSHKGGKNCCKSEHKQIKLDKTHQVSELSNQQLEMLATALPVHLYAEIPMATRTLSISHPESHAPPSSSLQPLYLLHCVYRI